MLLAIHHRNNQHFAGCCPKQMHIAASRQAQIVELGGLKLLLPLTQSKDVEVQRLAVHALANLSVDGECTINIMLATSTHYVSSHAVCRVPIHCRYLYLDYHHHPVDVSMAFIQCYTV